MANEEPPASCNPDLSARQCLAWHIHGRIPESKISRDGHSCRCPCPNHDDTSPSLVISLGDHAPITWHCHVCGKDARLAIRTKLHLLYGVPLACLPASRKEKAELDELVLAVFGAELTPCTKLLCIRALHEGLRGPVPRAPALIELGARAGVSRAQAFRAASELAGRTLNHLFISNKQDHVKQFKVTPASRPAAPVSNGDSVSNGDEDKPRSVSNGDSGGITKPRRLDAA